MATYNTRIDQEQTIDYEVNSEEMQEVITAVPHWILRWGITLIFMIMISIITISAFISYPDVVKTGLKVNSLNAPKVVFVKQTGKIISLLVTEGEQVQQDASLAFMESTANHKDVLKLHTAISEINEALKTNNSIEQTMLQGLNLGELQGAYQIFYQQYLQYIATQAGGYYINTRRFLNRDLEEIQKLKKQIINQQNIQKKEFSNIEQQFEAYKKLYIKNVISNDEYVQQENKYLAGKYPLQRSITDLINNTSLYAAKQKEILDLEHTIQDEKAKFTQASVNLLTEINAWLSKYIVSSPVSGKVSYAGIIQENQTVNANQELFIINPANSDFFGEVQIPQYNMGKVGIGQSTLIKMRSYPFEQYGLIRGEITYISDVALRDSVFIAKISFNKFENKDPDHKIILKNGMQADAEIITLESSLLRRFLINLTKIMNST